VLRRTFPMIRELAGATNNADCLLPPDHTDRAPLPTNVVQFKQAGAAQ